MSEAVTNTSLDRLDWSDLLDHQHQLCTSWQPLNHLYYQVGWSTGEILGSHCSHWLILNMLEHYATP